MSRIKSNPGFGCIFWSIHGVYNGGMGDPVITTTYISTNNKLIYYTNSTIPTNAASMCLLHYAAKLNQDFWSRSWIWHPKNISMHRFHCKFTWHCSPPTSYIVSYKPFLFDSICMGPVFVILLVNSWKKNVRGQFKVLGL